ncbi:MAG TPA: type II secretion system F family protein [Pirellulales bacterium]|jgi:tight adherence protein C|nr:type II secretion system F family protein [Pirellulales bacterium]
MILLIANALLTMERIVPIAVFGLFAVIVFWVLNVFAGKGDRTTERLEELRNPLNRRREKLGKGAKKQDAMSKMLEKATPVFSAPLQPKTEVETSKLKQKLSQAGFRGDAVAGTFLGLKFAGLMAGLFLGGGSIVLIKGANTDSLIYTVIVASFFFYLPDLVVWFIGRRRKQSIFLTLPDALDLLVVCVEAGLGLDQAMRKVTEEMRRTARVISEEFGLCNFHLQMGKSRNDVLRDLGERTGVDDVRSLAAILIQADKFGSSVAQALRVQSDSMRTRRRQLAEEKAAKTAVKLIFPLVIFIFPGIFVVLVGPAAITMVREMFPVMQGHK